MDHSFPQTSHREQGFRRFALYLDAMAGHGLPTAPHPYLSIQASASSIMEMVECSLPPLKLHEWDKCCYALVSRSKAGAITIKYIGTSLEDAKRYGMELYGRDADVPVDTMIRFDTFHKTWKQYIRCEYRVYLYYYYLKNKGYGMRVCIEEKEGREVLIYAGICKKYRTRLRYDD